MTKSSHPRLPGDRGHLHRLVNVQADIIKAAERLRQLIANIDAADSTV